jgi:hypothetical protein
VDILSITEWNTYLSTQAAVAATLTGLLFVAVSINLTRVLSVPGLTGRAAESLLQLFGVVIVATDMLIPRQSSLVLGTEVLLTGIALWLFESFLQIRYARSKTGHPRQWLITRVIQTQLATIPFLIAGILLLRGSTAGLYWLAPGFVFSLISGAMSAWVLLVEILR